MIQRSEVEAVLAEGLALIKSLELRKKVVDAYMLAIEEGGWQSMKDLNEMPFTLLTDTKGINFWEHTLAVTRGAIGLAKGQQDTYKKMPYAIDWDRLAAGGLLHDVGKLVESERKPDGTWKKSRKGEFARHPISGAIFCAKVGLPDDIVNTVACHAKEGEGAPKVLETVLIHQADFGTFDPLVMMSKGQLIQ
ncbi:MAG TPA: HD domain-containing protein [Myxococcales bacterium]|jgi:putative nucleotidyltransferase with HDIG domain